MGNRYEKEKFSFVWLDLKAKNTYITCRFHTPILKAINTSSFIKTPQFAPNLQIVSYWLILKFWHASNKSGIYIPNQGLNKDSGKIVLGIADYTF